MRPAKQAKYDDSVDIDIASQMKFLQLNDDCVEHVLKWLRLEDLCGIADTCSRLRDIASRHYGTYYSKYVSVRSPVDWTQYCVIRCFSQHIQKLEIDYWEVNRAMKQQIDMIDASSIESIVNLKLLNFDLCESSVAKIKNILKYARKIGFKYSSMEGGFNTLILRNCPNLKQLKFTRCRKMNFMWLKTKYNTLDSLTIIRSDKLYESSIQSYFNKNPNIKQLTYASTDTRPSIKWASKRLLENIDKIEQIKLSGRSDDMLNYDLVRLSQHGVLNECNIDFEFDWFSDGDGTVETFLNSVSTHHTFENLGLVRLERIDDTLCRAICNLTHLKVLKLWQMSEIIEYYDVLSKKLVNLETLYIHGCDIRCQDISTIVCNSKKLENMFLINCIHLKWDNLKDEMKFISTERRERPAGAVPLTLHVLEQQRMDWLYGLLDERDQQGYEKTFVITVSNTIKMIRMSAESKEIKSRPKLCIDITFT